METDDILQKPREHWAELVFKAKMLGKLMQLTDFSYWTFQRHPFSGHEHEYFVALTKWDGSTKRGMSTRRLMLADSQTRKLTPFKLRHFAPDPHDVWLSGAKTWIFGLSGPFQRHPEFFEFVGHLYDSIIANPGDLYFWKLERAFPADDLTAWAIEAELKLDEKELLTIEEVTDSVMDAIRQRKAGYALRTSLFK